MKVGFLSLGCKTNSYDTETILSLFERRGYEIVRDHGYADIFIINTCSVTNMAERKSRQAVERVLKLNPNAIIAVTGCYAQIKPEEIKSLRNVAVVVGNRDRANIVDMVEEYISTGKGGVQVSDVLKNSVFEDIDIDNYSGRTRVQLKIQDGCDNFCSYCIIPYARGHICSKPMEKVLEQVEDIKRQGFKEIVLTGIHIASYGRDVGGYDLVDLVENIHNTTNGTDIRIRLGSIDPNIASSEFVQRLSKLDRLCSQFHLSLQSGSDTVLKRMNRHYTTAQYYESVRLLREYFDDPSITTDIIVGFPGETDDEFLQTLDFADKIGFAKIHIFPYSKREGTAAAKMHDQIPHGIAVERERKLSAKEKISRENYIKSYVGKTVQVLFEETKVIDSVHYACGYTPEYIYVYVADYSDYHNTVRNVKILSYKDDIAYGELIN